MKAGVVIPRQKGTARLIDVPFPQPAGDEILVRIVRVTLDGTDAEINGGVYGEAPAGQEYLVIGHEALGQVEKTGNSGFVAGELVVPLVRRPGKCANCLRGRSDMCLDGDYRECGIKGAHGYLCQWAAFAPEFLVKVPANLRNTAMLAEPLSISVKGLEQAVEFHGARLSAVRSALILGAGSLGMLASALMRLYDFDVYVVDRAAGSSLKAQLLKSIGAHYSNSQQTTLSTIRNHAGNIDLVMETTGNGELVFEACRVLGINGVLCLMGISADERAISVDAFTTSTQLVMGNKVVFGTVSSSRSHFERALEALTRIQERWPGWLDRLITDRWQLEDFEQAFDSRGDKIKTAIEISEIDAG